jgi:hypothetical protein
MFHIVSQLLHTHMLLLKLEALHKLNVLFDLLLSVSSGRLLHAPLLNGGRNVASLLDGEQRYVPPLNIRDRIVVLDLNSYPLE